MCINSRNIDIIYSDHDIERGLIMYNDPRWITARFNSRCCRCKGEVKKGSQAFYYPRDKAVMCDSEDCGKQASRDFDAAVFDENMMSSQFGGY